MQLLHEYLQLSAERFPDKTALICGDREYTYRELYSKAVRLASGLCDAGIRRGDRVAIYLDNGPDAVVGVFGAWMAGACAVPIGTVTPVNRLAHLVSHSGATFVIVPGARLRQVREALANPCPQLLWTGPAGDHESEGSLQTLLARQPGDLQVADPMIDLDLAAIIYTSGSTGQPKGVTHTHRSIDTAVESIIGYLDNRPDDVILCVLQFNFSYGLLQLLATFRTGGTLVLEKGFGYPYEVVKQFPRHHITGFAGSPTIWAMLLQMSDLDPAMFASVRYVTNAAAAIPVPFIARLAGLFPNARIFLMHGLTECLRTTYLPPEQVLVRPTSVGKGMRNVELWLEDDAGNRLPPGGMGELVVRSSTVMVGYWNDPQETARRLVTGPHPWERTLHSGDTFRTDADGYLYFVARSDEIIKSRGERVSPVEVENVIYTLAPVAECRVIGVPDSVLGDRVRAEIVLREGGVLDETTVRRECARVLETYKVPHEVAFVGSLPKTVGGKIIRTRPR